jgi:hypothetical protein
VAASHNRQFTANRFAAVNLPAIGCDFITGAQLSVSRGVDKGGACGRASRCSNEFQGEANNAYARHNHRLAPFGHRRGGCARNLRRVGPRRRRRNFRKFGELR